MKKVLQRSDCMKAYHTETSLRLRLQRGSYEKVTFFLRERGRARESKQTGEGQREKGERES